MRFIVRGDDKRDAVERLLNDPGSIPAGRACTDVADVEVWCVA